MRVETPKLQLRKAPEQPPEEGTQEALPPSTSTQDPTVLAPGSESVSFLLLGLQTGAQLVPS